MGNATSCTEIEQYLHEHIPLSKMMGVTVTRIDGGVTLSAPLQPNINHRSTVFGGSLSVIAILSAWTLIHLRLQSLSLDCRIVIRSNRVEYIKPASGSFQAHCMNPSKQDWERFITTLSRKEKARIVLNAEIFSDSVLVGTFEGEYVAIKRL